MRLLDCESAALSLRQRNGGSGNAGGVHLSAARRCACGCWCEDGAGSAAIRREKTAAAREGVLQLHTLVRGRRGGLLPTGLAQEVAGDRPPMLSGAGCWPQAWPRQLAAMEGTRSGCCRATWWRVTCGA